MLTIPSYYFSMIILINFKYILLNMQFFRDRKLRINLKLTIVLGSFFAYLESCSGKNCVFYTNLKSTTWS